MKRLATFGAALTLGALGFVPSAALAQGGKQNPATYSMSGRVVDVDDDEIEIERRGLPKAELDVNGRTRIRVDGQDAGIRDLQNGMQVNAQFQIAEDDIIAVEIDAMTAQ